MDMLCILPPMFLFAGLVRVSTEGNQGQESILGVLYPDDFFGEMAHLDGLPGSATVTALEKREVPAITRKGVLECSHSMPQIATKMIVTLSLRLRRTDRNIGSLVFLTAPRRVAPALLKLTQGQGAAPRTASPSVFPSRDKNWPSRPACPGKPLRICLRNCSRWEF